MYAKGANILHTLRQIIDDDEKFYLKEKIFGLTRKEQFKIEVASGSFGQIERRKADKSKNRHAHQVVALSFLPLTNH